MKSKKLISKRTKKYKIEYRESTHNEDPCYVVTGDGQFLTGHSTREKAEKYISDRKQTVILRTKRIDSYFQGVIRKGYFPLDGYKYHVDDVSGSGGRVPMLDILDFKAGSERKLLLMLHAFKRKHNLILEHL